MGNVYTVAQVNSYIKHLFEEDFALNKISIKGEVSNCKYHSSGHIYFTIKDKSSAISAVMFAGNRNGLAFFMEDGQKIIATGTVNVYERDGKYQLYAKEIVQDGQGDLYQKFEKLKAELLEMGMFDAEYKKTIPRFATKIGIVTSPTGAAIQDIINIAGRRNPYVQLYLAPAIVQGEEAVSSIIQGINRLDEMGMDVIIVGRGGGSIEDLWAFNEEAVARAVFSCNTPVISAVGHETDITIIDYVADLRAPTPSAAAELAVFDFMQFQAELDSYGYTLERNLKNKLEAYRSTLENFSLRLEKRNPKNVVNDRRQLLDFDYDKLQRIIKKRLDFEKYRLSLAAEKLTGLSPLKKLESGFSYVTDEQGKNIKSIEQIQEKELVHIILADGEADARIVEVKRGKEDDNRAGI